MERSDFYLANIQRTKERFAQLRDRYRAARFRWERLAAAFDGRWRRLFVAALHPDPSRFPLGGVALRPEGALRRPRRDHMAGNVDTLLRCWTEASPGAMVVHVEGEVDLQTAPMLGDAIAAAYRAGPRVIVDFSTLRYLDGSGVHVLQDAAREHPTRFVVVGSNREIHRVFVILELVTVLPVVHSLEAAREYFGQQ